MITTPPTVDDLLDLVRVSIDELGPSTSADTTFLELELDSLSIVEIATIVGQTYAVPLDESDVLVAGDFAQLAALVQQRMAP
ncbi:acyl carrier protein [Rathayibacter agropyri]